MKAKHLKFTKHTTGICPVPMDSIVVYRTTSKTTPKSHIHAPVLASKVNWGTNMIMGEILEYAVVVL